MKTSPLSLCPLLISYALSSSNSVTKFIGISLFSIHTYQDQDCASLAEHDVGGSRQDEAFQRLVDRHLLDIIYHVLIWHVSMSVLRASHCQC